MNSILSTAFAQPGTAGKSVGKGASPQGAAFAALLGQAGVTPDQATGKAAVKGLAAGQGLADQAALAVDLAALKNAVTLEQIDLPGTPAQQAALKGKLAEVLDAFAVWVAAQMPQAAPQAVPQASTQPSGLGGAQTLASASTPSTLQAPHPLMNLVSQETASSSPPALTRIAGQLGQVLQQFDQAHGTNAAEVLTRNAAKLADLTLPADGPDAAPALLGLSRALLRVAPSEAATLPQPVKVEQPLTASTGTQAAPTQVSFAQVLETALARPTPQQPPAPTLDSLQPTLQSVGAPQDSLRAAPAPDLSGLFAEAAAPKDKTAPQAAAASSIAAAVAGAMKAEPAPQATAPGQAPEAAAPLPAVGATSSVSGTTAPAAAPPPPPATPATPSGFAANLLGQIKGHQIGEGTTRIELAPRGLGSIEIDLVRSDNGEMKVTIRAENTSVMGALRDGRDALLLTLRDNGVAMQSGALGFEDFDRGRGQQHQQQQTSATAQIAEETASEPLADTTPHTDTMLRDGRIDIMT